MKLIVGLGNPDKKYENTRHNTGFMVIDALCQYYQVSLTNRKFKGEYTKFKYKGEDILLLKPMTYMNNSGESVIEIMNFFKIDTDDLLVIYDDLDLPVGKLRLRVSGSAGGHNGIKSIIKCIGTQQFKRIRVGIDKLPLIDTVDYVLGKFTPTQKPLIEEGISQAVKAVDMYINYDFTKAMNEFNKKA